MDVMVTDLYSSLARNALDQWMPHTWPNGMTTNYTYDDDGRLTGIQHKDGTTVEEGWAYTLNEGGNIRHVANAADDNNSEAWEYYYDSRDRLVEALQRGESSKPESCYVYAYDKADNMTSKIKYDAQVYWNYRDRLRIKPFFCVRKCDCSVCLAPQKRDRQRNSIGL